MVDDVFTADTWRLDDQLYDLSGPVQIASLSVLPARITTGAADRDQEQVRSSWILEDWSGGLGIVEMDETTESDRFQFGTLDTRRRRTATRPPKAQSTTNAPASTRLRTAAQYETSLYGAWDTKVRLIASGSSAWATPSEGTYTDLLANGTDSLVLRLGTSDWLVFADGEGTLRYDGTTWTYQNGNGTTLPDAQFLQEWFARLYTLDVNNVLWWTDDFVTWHKVAPLPVPQGSVRRLGIFFDTSQAPQLHATTNTGPDGKGGLWIYNAEVGTVGQWFRTRLNYPGYPTAGAADEWHGDWYQAAGQDTYHNTGGSGPTVNPMGLSRDDGLPSDWRGDITSLVSTHNWLIAGLTAYDAGAGLTDALAVDEWFASAVVETSPARSALFAWTGAAWHTIWTGAQSTLPLDWVGVTAIDRDVRLWWGYAGVAYWQQLPVGVFQPRDLPDWEYEDTGFVYSSRFDGGHPEWRKLACTWQSALRNASATATAAVQYSIDNGDTWQALTTTTEDRPDPVIFGTDGEGLEFYHIQLRIDLTASDSSTALEFDFGVLTYVPNLDRLYSITATIDLSDPNTSRELEEALQTTLDNGGLVTSSFRREGQEVGPQSGRVFILSYRGLVGSGHETYGKHTVQAVGLSG